MNKIYFLGQIEQFSPNFFFANRALGGLSIADSNSSSTSFSYL